MSAKFEPIFAQTASRLAIKWNEIKNQLIRNELECCLQLRTADKPREIERILYVGISLSPSLC